MPPCIFLSRKNHSSVLCSAILHLYSPLMILFSVLWDFVYWFLKIDSLILYRLLASILVWPMEYSSMRWKREKTPEQVFLCLPAYDYGLAVAASTDPARWLSSLPFSWEMVMAFLLLLVPRTHRYSLMISLTLFSKYFVLEFQFCCFLFICLSIHLVICSN